MAVRIPKLNHETPSTRDTSDLEIGFRQDPEVSSFNGTTAVKSSLPSTSSIPNATVVEGDRRGSSFAEPNNFSLVDPTLSDRLPTASLIPTDDEVIPHTPD